jgi:hypothetical protein
VQRWLFRRELEKLDGRTVFYLDECGVDHRLYREYGRAPRGERIYQAVAGKRRERTSIIAAFQQNKLVAPLVFQGNCNTEVVDVYFEEVLLPALPPGSVIVLDNARFHQSPTTQKLVAAASCQLLFLPPSRPACAKTSPPPPTPSFLSPICPNVIVKCYSSWFTTGRLAGAKVHATVLNSHSLSFASGF